MFQVRETTQDLINFNCQVGFVERSISCWDMSEVKERKGGSVKTA